MTEDDLRALEKDMGDRIYIWCGVCGCAVPLRCVEGHRDAHGRSTVEEIENWLREVRS